MPVPVRCHACGSDDLRPLADLGDFPVRCGAHWADEQEARASGGGQVSLAFCPSCGYLRNAAFEWSKVVYDTSVDYDLQHSAAYAEHAAAVVDLVAARAPLRERHVVELACAQGEFLRELCQATGATGDGYDAKYAGPTGPDPSGAVFHRVLPPTDASLSRFDLVVSRHWLEHVEDPHAFLSELRERAGDREVHGYFEVPDAAYDLSTAGWEIIYPHVSYFDAYALVKLLQRTGWRVTDTGTLFHGVLRYATVTTAPGEGFEPPVTDRDRHLATIAGFPVRHFASRDAWRKRLSGWAAGGARPVLWGAGSRGVQFLSLADAGHHLAAVVDVSPRKWGRYLPVTAHRVDPPAVLTEVKPEVVVITNPAYQEEIAGQLAALGVTADLVVA